MDGMMQEYILRWALNGVEQASMLCSPGEEEELLTGYLLTGMTVPGPASIRGIERVGEVWQVSADVSAAARTDLCRRLALIRPCEAPLPCAAEEVLRLSEALMATDKRSGQHAALIAVRGDIAVSRDIGRHNALDKAIGRAARAGWPLSQAVFCTSGRLSIEILAKAAAAGIPVVCTRKQVGDLADRYAAAWNIAVVQAGKAVRFFGAKRFVEGGEAG